MEEILDAAFCFYCHKAEQKGKLKNTTKNLSFISKGFVNWKDATETQYSSLYLKILVELIICHEQVKIAFYVQASVMKVSAGHARLYIRLWFNH